MTKKQIYNLAKNSFVENNLDKSLVERIVGKLKRKELKIYVRALKSEERKNSVVVSFSQTPTLEEKNMLANLFTGKKIIYKNDQNLLLGTKIVENDMIYNMNLQNKLHQLLSHLSK